MMWHIHLYDALLRLYTLNIHINKNMYNKFNHVINVYRSKKYRRTKIPKKS
jgi:hypothetical protein